ncbi:hypothetical protein B9T62_33285 [Paenibacillus donghaensis]|uniref:HTH araC/xylS-type domain-containing protein n=1 Tax=Paenibacillus donghaensis TaxID=414771 RepID=A0A2Z2KTK5_9BACL|nr:hypothetical protein B9T62_33285 [Paenibacillus donghaensis]
MLLLPSTLVSEAAEQTGFADLCCFSRAIKKQHGLSPQSYRKQSAQANPESIY